MKRLYAIGGPFITLVVFFGACLPRSLEARTLPDAPSNLAATAVSASQINVSWADNSANETGFTIERRQNIRGTPRGWRRIATVNANVTNFSDTGLLPDSEYTYRVRAFHSKGQSPWSNPAGARTLSLPPAAPSSLTATAVSTNQINLSWKDNSWNEDGFKVERSLDATNFTEIAQVSANTTNYSDGGLLPDTTYCYRVRAYKSTANSAFSDVASASTPAPPCPLSIAAWGNNDYGQATPTNLTGVVAIAAGLYHSLALKSDGTVGGWGYDYEGEATPPTNLIGVVAIAAGFYHSLALKSDGTVSGWGYDYDGQATPPADLTNVVAIAAGGAHSLALKNDGTVSGWGADYVGQATPPTDLTNVVAIAAGDSHSLALKSDGTVVGWGDNSYSQATPPTDLTNVMAIAGGYYHSLALKSDGTIVGWGTDYIGQTTPPAGLSNVVAIAAGYDYSLALKSDGTVVGWGYDDYFQASGADGLTGASAVAAGGYHALALTTAPGTPSAPAAIIVATNQVDLSWMDNSSNVEGFGIERALDDGYYPPRTWVQIAVVGGNVTHYSDTTVETNVRYWYRMRSESSACGNSLYTYPIVLTVAPPNYAPNLYAYPNSTNQIQVDLQWYAYSGNEAGYKIERAPDASGSPGTWTEIATIPATIAYSGSYTDTNVVANITNWYRVRGYNVFGDSPYSSPVRVSVGPPPYAPYVYGYLIATNQVELFVYWYDYNNYSGNVAGYKLERAPDNSGSPGTWTEITNIVGYNYYNSYLDTGFPATNATYWYRVRAYNVLGESPYSYPASVSVVSPAEPCCLRAFAVPEDLKVSLSWGSSDFAAGYKIERAPDTGGSPGAWTEITATVGAYLTSYYDAGVSPNAAYWYRVRAYNVVGNSPYGPSVSVSLVPPAAPSKLTALIAATNQVNLSWKKTGTNVAGYKVERAPDAGGNPGTWVQIGTTTGISSTLYSDTTVVLSATYWYRVRAYNAAGDSPYSNEVSVEMTPTTAPSNLTATAVSGTRIDLSWMDNSSNESGFKVERSTDGTNFIQIAQVLPNTTNYRNSGLSSDTTYYYRVRAYNGLGDSDFSNMVSASTLPQCSASVVGWGYSFYATPPTNLTGVVAIAAGEIHSLALKSDSTVSGWGYDYEGQATPPTDLTNVVAIAAGGSHSLALKADGTVVGWGYSFYATPPTNLTGVVAIAAGASHSLALKADGTVVGWGYNGAGQATPPTNLTGVVAIAAGGSHSLALMSDGTVVGWGNNGDGQATPPTNLTGVVAIAGGYYHSLALRSDGTVVGWGYNGAGQATPPTNLTGVVAIAAGGSHSLALMSDGTVVGWGYNGSGQRTPPAGLNGVMAIAAGGAHSLAARSDVPNAPSGLIAVAVISNQVDLSWTDNSDNEDGFKVERAPDAGGSPGTWTQLTMVVSNVTTYSDTTVETNTSYWYRVRAFIECGDSPYSNEANPLYTPVLLDDTWLTGTRTNQNLPTSSAWWVSSGGNLTAATGAMTLPVGISSVMAITYFTPDSNSPPVRLNVGDTLTVTFKFVFDGVPPTGSSSQGFRIGVFNFADSTLNPKRVSADGFSSGSQGNGVQGYSLFGKMYGTFADDQPIDIRKRTSLADASLLGASGAWNWSVKDHLDTSAFPGFANLTPYSLQFVLQRTGLNSLAITMTWLNMDNGATLSESVTDTDAGNFSFDGIAFRPPNNSQAPAVNQFTEVKVELKSTPVASSIILPPQDQSVSSGQNATFTVVANGTLPLRYQWYYNTTTPLANGTNSTLTLTNIQLADAGGYSVVISNSYGSETSRVAQLTVSAIPPSIVTQPQGRIVNPGQSAVFNVVANGSEPLSYQWYYNTNTLLNGATTRTLTLSNIQPGDAGSYSVVVSNAANSVSSSNAVLIVVLIPLTPSGLTATAVSGSRIDLGWTDNSGNEDEFRIERALDAGGAPGTWSQIAAAGTDVSVYSDLTVTTNTTYWYRVRAHNAFGDSPYSNETSVRVYRAQEGFHTVNGDTIGGEGGSTVIVSNLTDFQNAVGQSGPLIVQVQGTIYFPNQYIIVASQKTIIGLGTNATLVGDLVMSGVSNIIVQNIFVTNPNPVSDPNAGANDGFTIIDGSHHIWVDHCTFSDCSDGMLDITRGSDFITISWCKFYYTFDSGHNFVNLIGSDDSIVEDMGKFHVTFHHNWWSTLCHERMPRVRYGRVHSYNNYFNAPGNNYCVRASLESEVLIEGDYFENVDTPWEVFITTGTPGKVMAVSNIFVNVTGTNDPGTNTVFTPPYTYTLDDVADIPNIVTNNAGAGNPGLAATPFAQWQMVHFGCTNCPAAAAAADPDSDRMDNSAEFLAGTDPTNSVSVFGITAITKEGSDIRVTWTMGSGKAVALQSATLIANGGFTDVFIVTNIMGATINYLDVGAATNTPARYYRLRMAP